MAPCYHPSILKDLSRPARLASSAESLNCRALSLSLNCGELYLYVSNCRKAIMSTAPSSFFARGLVPVSLHKPRLFACSCGSRVGLNRRTAGRWHLREVPLTESGGYTECHFYNCPGKRLYPVLHGRPVRVLSPAGYLWCTQDGV